MADGRERLRDNPYPGRGIIIGLDASGRYAVQLYWLTGRSAGSRNRILVIEGGEILTQPFDIAARTDDPNIYYRAIASTGSLHVVTNGNHTDLIIDHLKQGGSFEDAMQRTSYETDAPNFTPRIAGLTDLSGPRPAFYLAHARKGDSDAAIHGIYAYEEVAPGHGYCLHTYAENGDPLPSFSDSPYEIELLGTPEAAASDIWELLPADRRVALALKTIDIATKRVSAITVRNTLS